MDLGKGLEVDVDLLTENEIISSSRSFLNSPDGDENNLAARSSDNSFASVSSTSSGTDTSTPSSFFPNFRHLSSPNSSASLSSLGSSGSGGSTFGSLATQEGDEGHGAFSWTPSYNGVNLRQERRTGGDGVAQFEHHALGDHFDVVDVNMNEPQYKRALQEILDRFHSYNEAKRSGNLGVSEETIKELASSKFTFKCTPSNEQFKRKTLEPCVLCFEDFKQGDFYTVLPCGHYFHSGLQHGPAADDHCGVRINPQSKAKRRKVDNESCKGVLYWLADHQTCPRCREKLPTKIPKPSRSEMILVPMICAQYETIDNKKQEISTLTNENSKLKRQLAATQEQLKQFQQLHFQHFEQFCQKRDNQQVTIRNQTCNLLNLLDRNSNIKVNISDYGASINLNISKVLDSGVTVSINTDSPPAANQVENFSPQFQCSWHDRFGHKHMRLKVLQRVLTIATQSYIGRCDVGAIADQLHNLAAKAELFLYCTARDYQNYVDEKSFHRRVVEAIKSVLGAPQTVSVC